jgi:hypothetical protein
MLYGYILGIRFFASIKFAIKKKTFCLILGFFLHEIVLVLFFIAFF